MLRVLNKRLNALIFGALASLLGGVDAATSAPTALSINLCSDQLLLLLADPKQIKAVSVLSYDDAGSYLHNQARMYPQADAFAEEILPYAPDVVLTGPYTSRNTLALLSELGLNVTSLEIANSLEAMMRNIELVGSVLHQETRASEIVSTLRHRLVSIENRSRSLDEQYTNPDLERPRAAVYDANGYTVGANSMRGEAISLAGWHNVAADKGIEAYGVISLEELIILSPQALIESPYSPETYSRGQRLATHPAIRQSGLNPLVVSLPSNTTICAGPWSVDNIDTWLDARDSLL